MAVPSAALFPASTTESRFLAHARMRKSAFCLAACDFIGLHSQRCYGGSEVVVSMFGVVLLRVFFLQISICRRAVGTGGAGVVALLRRHSSGTISVRSWYFAGLFFEISICRRAMRGEEAAVTALLRRL